MTSLCTAVNGLELGIERVESRHECPILTSNVVSAKMEGYEVIDTLIVTVSVVTVATGVLAERSNEPVKELRLFKVVEVVVSSKVYPPHEWTPAAFTVAETAS